jgi:hypothetical protein
MVFRVIWSCNLVEKKQFCCNPPYRDSVMRQITVDYAWICAVGSKSFLLVAKDYPISVMVNQDPLMLMLKHNFPWKSQWRALRRCVTNFSMMRKPHCQYFGVWVWYLLMSVLDECFHMLFTIQRWTLISWLLISRCYNHKNSISWHTSCLCCISL